MHKYKKYLKKIKKIKKYICEISKKISQKYLDQTLERERERREKKSNFSPTILRGFVGRNSAGRELKLLYKTRATRGYQNHKISPRSKVRVIYHFL